VKEAKELRKLRPTPISLRHLVTIMSGLAFNETVVAVLQDEEIFTDGIHKLKEVLRILSTKNFVASMGREIAM
jgi:hypothetical protein